jgi:hypothetical protein
MSGTPVEPLRLALQVAVPIWIRELKRLPAPGQLDAVRMAWAKNAADAIAHEGDTLMFQSRPGRSAETFNQLAKGLAAGAFQPGGITFAGMQFEATADDLLCREPRPAPGQPTVDVELP